MERDIDMSQVSDGRFYTANDLVKADCAAGGWGLPSRWTHWIFTACALGYIQIFPDLWKII